MEEVKKTKDLLLKRLETLKDKRAILRAPELRALYAKIRDQPEDQRAVLVKRLMS